MASHGYPRTILPWERVCKEMSKLAFFGRPYVVFDPSDKNHRRWFAEFQANRAWGQCPVRFIVADDQGDLVTMIQRKLIEFYTMKEFGHLDLNKRLTKKNK
jgi:hypothetical protein